MFYFVYRIALPLSKPLFVSHLVSIFFFFFICGAEAGVAETREEVVIEVSRGGKRDAKKPTHKSKCIAKANLGSLCSHRIQP